MKEKKNIQSVAEMREREKMKIEWSKKEAMEEGKKKEIFFSL